MTVTVSDGGRSRNNGDSAAGISIVSGPPDLVNNGIFGAVPNLAALGNNNATSATGDGTPGGSYVMSDGNNATRLDHANVLSLIAKITHDIDTGVPFPTAISPKTT